LAQLHKAGATTKIAKKCLMAANPGADAGKMVNYDARKHKQLQQMLEAECSYFGHKATDELILCRFKLMPPSHERVWQPSPSASATFRGLAPFRLRQVHSCRARSHPIAHQTGLGPTLRPHQESKCLPLRSKSQHRKCRGAPHIPPISPCFQRTRLCNL